MNEKFEIYRMNAEFADRLDQRRDSTANRHGATCVGLAAIAAGALEQYPLVSGVLWVALFLVALSWTATTASLTTKLTAKSHVLREMEEEFGYSFLVKESARWKAQGKPSLQVAMTWGPLIFITMSIFGVGLAMRGG